MAVQKQDDQHEHTFSSYVRIWDVVLKTCLGRWTIGRSGERGSGISVLPVWHDDDDDDWVTYQVQIWLLSQLYDFSRFLYDWGSSGIWLFLVWFMQFRMFKSFMIRSLSTFLFLIDKSTEKALDWMMNLLKLLVKTMLSASSIVQVLAVNIEASFWEVFWNVFWWILQHIQFNCCLWSHLYKCGSS